METPTTNIQEAATDIARQLQENNTEAVAQIGRIVEYLGAEETYTLVTKALEAEKEGGMQTVDGRRARTLGGIFFHLARRRIPSKVRPTIWLHLQNPQPQPRKPAAAKPRKDARPGGGGRPGAKPGGGNRQQSSRPGSGGYRAGGGQRPSAGPTHPPTATEVPVTQGDVSNVKITVTGRPNRIIERGDVILMPMANTKIPMSNRNLPSPPADPVVYLVYLARNQWEKIASAVENSQARLVVEGYPFYDKKLGVISILTQQATVLSGRPTTSEEEDEG